MADEPTGPRGYGWKPQLPDHRDRIFNRAPAALPPATDLRANMPAVYDQGQLNSCTANAIGAAMEYERVRQGGTDFIPSRLFIYYNERSLEGTISTDNGAYIRDGIKVVNNEGVCPESLWAYDPAMFAHRPPRRCYLAASRDKALGYEAIQALGDLKGALAIGLAVVFGFTVYESFESQQVATTGVMPMPASGERTVGGHAVVAVGYRDDTSQLIVRNSWGAGWGDHGYFYMPYAYLTGPTNVSNNASVNGGYLTSDVWAIEQTS